MKEKTGSGAKASQVSGGSRFTVQGDENFYKQKFQIGIKYLFLYLQQKAASINYLGIETDKRVATPITFVY